MTFKLILAAGLLGAAVTTTPALAKSTAVEYADLDLATPAGQAKLDARIERAARSVCRVETTGSRVRGSQREAECLTVARRSAREQVAARIQSERKGG